MIKKLPTRALVCAATALCFTATTHAGTTGKEMKSVVEKVKESCITGDLGVNVVSQYISRGLVLENQGAIAQPYADLYFKLFSGDGFLNAISLNLGVWSSWHDRHTDAAIGSTTRGWYEFDFTAGLSFTFAKNFTLTPSYFSFLSPNDGFATFQGLNVKLAADTTDWFGFNLAPAVTVLFELENKAGNGADEGIYYEVSVAPSFPVGPLTVTVPIVAGFGSNDFYAGDEGFGFVSGGVTLSYALAFIPECYGKWTASAGYTYYYLGEALNDFNTGPGRIRDANDTEHVFSGGLGIAF